MQKLKTKHNTTTSFNQLYEHIKQVIDLSRATAYRTVNALMVKTYWEVGRFIFEEEQKGKQRADYGSYLIRELSKRLTIEYGKGFDERNLIHMRQFYKVWPIANALRSQLSWTHYRLILKVEDEKARSFYLQEAIDCNWSTRTLERQINSLYYNRVLLTKKENRPFVKAEAENNKEPAQVGDLIKDHYILEFLNLNPNKQFYEKELEQGLIDKLQEFLLELGKGFSFVSRQYRISAEDEHFYVDLVFYNYILKCFLLIDLKTGKLTHQDIGQMDMYVRFFEEEVRQKNDNPTIGLILCAEKNKAIAKYSLLNDSKQIFASKYKLYLPSEEELVKELEKERELVEIEQRLKK
ncbi:MAG TPA: PDDEXK nuclease domain-containing protein [Bacteroidia bacterium]|nr:PDDEXK nuclease domain-containing protein [Bacteroidia bacterium]HRG51501.1 PDDEXK nuclease domain-containing protein [Bacteroidia bacterium]